MTIERVSGLGQVNNPAISHDGKLLAYVRTEAGENAIWLRQMATGSVVRVVGPTPNNIAHLQFTPDDTFLFYSENTTTRPIRYTLMAAPAFGGTAREVSEGRFLSRASFAPDGKRFVALRETPTAYEVVVMNADGTGTPSTIVTRPKSDAGFAAPSWSPSGTHLAVVVGKLVDTVYRTDIQIMRPDGSEPRTLTPSGSPLLSDLSWAANDDSLIASGSLGSFSAPLQLILIRASDGRVERITNDANTYSPLSFSRAAGLIATVQTARLGSIWIGPVDRPEEAREVPSRLSERDGASGLSWLNDQQLVFTRETDVPSLWMMNADGGGARRLTEGFLSIYPRASRDGRVVVFDSARENANLPDSYRMTMPEGRVTRITHENAAGQSAVSPDGGTVFFSRFLVTPVRLLRTAIDGGPATSIFEAPAIYDHAVSPDGTRIAVVANSGVGTPRTISVLSVGGGEARTIFTTGAALEHVRWYPSGDALLLLISEKRQRNMVRLDLASGQTRPLTRFTRGDILNPEISPDGRRIAYYRGTIESGIVLVKPAR
jgi:Tol biopolymer transport system component